ncbi:Rqc2 family fibronectin-binding protein [Clostridium algidicarnis]|uniref:Rqc2 family fibronectin-binding protein n=1 Tax=Clostridium algidicarnis TaxID=37659 RepID=UPI0016284835|nr:NFACT RNA binding domain-containing protein [Clostridium algidicarnis]MBB6631256.1 NFACT family protein [Clostridium algidicarnis]
MALDGIFLHSIVSELKSEILNAKIDKVNQPEKDEIILSIRCSSGNKKLLISSNSNYPRIHFSEESKANPASAPMFCMILRKYIVSGRIKDITQLNNDRVLIIDVENTDDLGFDSIYSLVIEIMGRHSNITLVRKRDGIVMDSIKHITPEINSYRSIYPGLKFKYPPSFDKLNPLNCSNTNIITFIKENDLDISTKTASLCFNGVSKLLSEDIYKSCLSLEDVDQDLNSYANICMDYFSNIRSNNFEFISYFDENMLKDFYCIDLITMKSYNKDIYTSPSKLIESFYKQKARSQHVHGRSTELLKLINTNLDRCNKKIDILKSTLEECKNKDEYKIKGELLTANIYSITQGKSEVSLQNYYGDEDEYITIKLDENKTVSENIQSFYKKYNKYKKSEAAAKIQLSIAADEIEYLNSVLNNLVNIEQYEEIEEIRSELVESGYLKRKILKKGKKKISKPMHFISSEGLDIYVGKNNIQNDYLTLKFANKQDTWLHTKDIPGSHVIIKGTNISDTTLLEAATLAAYYSKSKDSSNVPVDYTLVKNVKKPSGAKPGMVIYYTNKTLYINPKDLGLKRV